MKQRNLVALLLCLLLSAGTAQGASLADFQQMAQDNREILQRYANNVEQSRADAMAARGAYYPTVDLSYGINRLREPSLFEARENSVLYGAVSWNLFNGFRDRYNVAATGFTIQAEEYRLAALRQDIRLNVALAYLAIYERMANLKVEESTGATLKRIYSDAEKRFAVGLLDRNDLLKFKVDLDHATIARKKAAAGLEKAVQRFGRQLDAPVSIATLTFDEFDRLPEPPADAEATMLAHRSDLLALQQARQAARMHSLAARAGYLPQLNWINSYQKTDSSYLATRGPAAAEEFRSSMQLSINLFDGFRKQAQVRKAALQERAVDLERITLEQDLKTELANLLTDFAVSQDNVQLAATSVEQADENLRVSKLKYGEGLETETDLLNAVSNQARARYDQIAARVEVFANYFKLLRLVEGL